MKVKHIKIPYALLSFIGLMGYLSSCSDDNSQSGPRIYLSQLSLQTAVGDTISVDVTLRDQTAFSKIDVKKAIDGSPVNSYSRQINPRNTVFPYRFSEEVISGDETGNLIYSFYGYDDNGKLLDASDLVATVELAQIPLLLKYDWKLSSQIIQGDDYATADLTDDIYRFNPDLTWELDWGSVLSAGALETLNSYCSWQVVMKGSTVDSLYMIKYNIFSPTVPIMTKYKVIQLANRKMILESRQDLSFLPGYAADEKVTETYEPVSKSTDFTPYRGSNPDSYIVGSCTPGNY
ncbi:hypothetical protein [Prevotella sp. KH2C16]|uniref:hypothetical protein n=1 Tax=Prevotella sp. KH2C16 TaxID=1855325 RepID=UPI0008EF77B0|nr:hypothetical protein [Prevotella sp. KH2C16]SFG69886.1 hypothetical protein SAMN05216383_1304 [Prevotella sp. KH2C16]